MGAVAALLFAGEVLRRDPQLSGEPIGEAPVHSYSFELNRTVKVLRMMHPGGSLSRTRVGPGWALHPDPDRPVGRQGWRTTIERWPPTGRRPVAGALRFFAGVFLASFLEYWERTAKLLDMSVGGIMMLPS